MRNLPKHLKPGIQASRQSDAEGERLETELAKQELITATPHFFITSNGLGKPKAIQCKAGIPDELKLLIETELSEGLQEAWDTTTNKRFEYLNKQLPGIRHRIGGGK